MERMIQMEGVTKVYQARQADEFTALRDATLSVEKGEAVVFRGPSGSGKTTLLGLMGCMSRPTSGSIVVKGRDVAKLPERFLTKVRRETVGFIFQDLNLINDISAVENVLLPLYPADERLADGLARAEELLRRFSLQGRGRQKVRTFSGGERQRVAIARALINNPDIIIADEPTAHLDRKLSEEFLIFLEELKREGRTVLIATHDPFVADAPFIQRVVEMRDGRVLGDAVP